MYQDAASAPPLAAEENPKLFGPTKETPTPKTSARRGKDSARGAPGLRTIQEEDQEATPQKLGCGAFSDAEARLEQPTKLSGQGGKMLMDHALLSFVATMQHETEVSVLLDDGDFLEVVATLDSSASELLLRVNGVARSVALVDVERVCGPEEAAQACTANSSHLSDNCVTLVLSSTHFLTFAFDTKHNREYFETCLRALVAWHHAKRGSPESCCLGATPSSASKRSLGGA